MLASAYRLRVHRPKKVFSRYDYIVCEGVRVICFAEFKDRSSKASTKYKTYMTGFDKWSWLSAMSRSSGVPAFLFVLFSDGLFRVRITDKKYLVEYDPDWGQYRGSSDDIEPAVHIPIADFKKVEINPAPALCQPEGDQS